MNKEKITGIALCEQHQTATSKRNGNGKLEKKGDHMTAHHQGPFSPTVFLVSPSDFKKSKTTPTSPTHSILRIVQLVLSF